MVIPVNGESEGNIAMPRMLRDGLLVLNFLAAVFLLVALLSYSPADPGFSSSGAGGEIVNVAGPAGAWLADVLYLTLGYLAYVAPAWMLYYCYAAIAGRESRRGLLVLRIAGLLLVLVACASLTSLHLDSAGALSHGPGGVIGEQLARLSEPALARFGSSLLFLGLLLIGLTLSFSIFWASAVVRGYRWLLGILGWFPALLHRLGKRKRSEPMVARAAPPKERKMPGVVRASRGTREKNQRITPVMPASIGRTPPRSGGKSADAAGGKVRVRPAGNKLPSIKLLDPGSLEEHGAQSREALKDMSAQLVEKLRDFGIEVEVTAIKPGPVITRFEVQPAAGVKGNRITGLVRDLARSLAVASVRVVEHIPGRDVIGIEIPNENRELIRLSQVLESTEFARADARLSLALGHDILGKPIIVDLGRMPHLLVAGTTGSGKSVGINAMILSLLFKSSPEQVRLIMIDPKMLELSVYEGIPHLLTPVITDMKDAANGLRWCVSEMDRRYALLSALGVRNLSGFNKKVAAARREGKPLFDPTWQPDPALLALEQKAPELEPLPNIVVIVDELADMMMVVGKKVEELVARIAQKARAAGIHLILATQRPSVDVLTGLIKANIPTRLSFMVQSKVDSRTILGEGGAEQLLGNGDMLFLPPGGGVATRIHGAFVSDEEVHRVVADWKQRGKPEYIDAVTVDRNDRDFQPEAEEGEGGEVDELYDQAVHFVTESRKASISAVQRKLRIGYNRAARMIETMEQQGVVSAMNSNGGRDVLAQPAPGD